MQPGACPWDGFSSPEIDFCERNLCGWLVEPSNAVSSLAFWVVGIYLLRRARREGTRGFLSLVGLFSILIGTFSFVFHATMTGWGNFLDLASMCVLSGVMLAVNLGRLHRPFDRHRLSIYLVLVLASTAAIGFWLHLGVYIFGGQVAAAAALEGVLTLRARRRRRAIDFRHFWSSLAIFLSSWLVWILDIRGIACDPDNHWLQGHSLWHVGCALSVVTVYLYFRQFEHTEKL